MISFLGYITVSDWNLSSPLLLNILYMNKLILRCPHFLIWEEDLRLVGVVEPESRLRALCSGLLFD